jgi:alkanesulfonate monooxygenase SsuD/methylene tetrahydromethanopterin reductase-like flavin-dependent oxidoreductase (luciferase family)
MHEPLTLANTLASLDALSGGRVIAGVGVGWSAAEFRALGFEFADRGRRMDEALDLLRSAWRDDPVRVRGEDVRVLPRPAHDIPIWVGGRGERAHRRAVERGDGFHAIGVEPGDAGALFARLRRERPEESFTVSLRTGWDPQEMPPDTIRAEREAFEAAGIQHVVAAPWQSELDSWLRSMDLLAELVLAG